MPRRRPGVLLPLEIQIIESGIRLQALSGSFYGFAVARTLAERGSGNLLPHGTLYKALNRLAASGMLESTWEDAEVAHSAGRPRRRLYEVTSAGRAALAAQPAVPARPITGLRAQQL